MPLSGICFQAAAFVAQGLRVGTGPANSGQGGVALHDQVWPLAKPVGKQMKGVESAAPGPSLGIPGRDRASGEVVERAGGEGARAVHHGRRPHQAPQALPFI
jgi:hypothetical protein